MGHILFEQGITSDPGKFAIIVSLPIPTTVREVKGLLDTLVITVDLFSLCYDCYAFDQIT